MKKIILILQLFIIMGFHVQAQMISGPDQLCENSSDTYSVSGGTAPYDWTVGGGASIIGSPGVNVTITAGSMNFVITVTDANGSTTKAVAVNAKPTLAMTSNSPICEGSTLNLDCGFSGATSYIWAGPSGFTSNIKNPTRPNATPGMTGAYNVTVTDGNSCTNVGSIMVTVNAKPTLAMTSNSPICEGLTLNLDCGFSGATSYIWAGPSGFTSNIKNPTRPNATPGMTGIYNVTVNDRNGCSKTDTIQINVKILPTSPTIINPIKSICKNETVKFSSSGCNSGKVEWYDNMSGLGNPISLQNDIEDIPQKSKKYYVFCRANDCLSAQGAEAQVTVFDNPNPGQISSTPQLDPIHVCDIATIKLNSSGVQGGIWSVSNFNVANIDSNSGLLKGINQGSVTVTYQVKDTHQNLTCISKTTKDVRIDESPTVTIQGASPTCKGEPISLTATATRGNPGLNDYKYNWSNGIKLKNVMEKVFSTSNYMVSVTDENGCSATDMVSIKVNELPIVELDLVDIPTVATKFRIKGKVLPNEMNSIIISRRIIIRDAIGNKILDTTIMSDSFDFRTPELQIGKKYSVCFESRDNNNCKAEICKDYIIQSEDCQGFINFISDSIVICLNDSVDLEIVIPNFKNAFDTLLYLDLYSENNNILLKRDSTIKNEKGLNIKKVIYNFKANLIGSYGFRVAIIGKVNNINDTCYASATVKVRDLPKISLSEDKICVKNIDSQVAISLSIDDQFLKNSSPFKLTYLNNPTFVGKSPMILLKLKTNGLSEEVIFNVKVENDSTTCKAELFDTAYVYRIPKFDFKDSAIIACSNASKLIIPHHYQKGSVLFEWKKNVDTLPFIKDSIININPVMNGVVSYKYQITNAESKIISCFETGKFEVDGKQRPEIDTISELLKCSGLFKLTLNIGKIDDIGDPVWSPKDKNTKIEIIYKDLVRVNSSGSDSIKCKIFIGDCEDSMSIRLPELPLVITNDTTLRSLTCNEKVLLYTNLKGCFSWFFIEPSGKVSTLPDTTPFISIDTFLIKLNKYFVRAYDCNGKDCGTTSLFHRSSSNEEHCQDFLHPNVKLYPNPNNGSFTLIVDEFPPGLYLLKVFDLLGRELYQSESILNSKNAKLDYQLESNLASGMYFVSFGNGSGIRFTIPILITK